MAESDASLFAWLAGLSLEEQLRACQRSLKERYPGGIAETVFPLPRLPLGQESEEQPPNPFFDL